MELVRWRVPFPTYLRVSKMSGEGPTHTQRKRKHRQLPPIRRTRQGQIGFLDIPFHTDT